MACSITLKKCKAFAKAANPDLIKYTTYYTDEASWSMFAAIQDMQDNPTDWSKFKEAILSGKRLHRIVV